MNSIVRAWNRSQVRRKPDVPDALIIEEGEKVLVQGYSTNAEKKRMVNQLRKVSINKGAVQELACHGPQDRIESLFRETHRTIQRLGLAVPDSTKPLAKSPRFEGGRPSVHDVVRWLDDLRTPGETEGPEVTKALNKDLKWVKRLHVTLRDRCHTPVVKEVEGK